jgi:hypothetical protein
VAELQLIEAQDFIVREADNLRRLGMAAPLPDQGRVLMAIVLVLDDLLAARSSQE